MLVVVGYISRMQPFKKLQTLHPAVLCYGAWDLNPPNTSPATVMTPVLHSSPQ